MQLRVGHSNILFSVAISLYVLGMRGGTFVSLFRERSSVRKLVLTMADELMKMSCSEEHLSLRFYSI